MYIRSMMHINIYLWQTCSFRWLSISCHSIIAYPNLLASNARSRMERATEPSTQATRHNNDWRNGWYAGAILDIELVASTWKWLNLPGLSHIHPLPTCPDSTTFPGTRGRYHHLGMKWHQNDTNLIKIYIFQRSIRGLVQLLVFDFWAGPVTYMSLKPCGLIPWGHTHRTKLDIFGMERAKSCWVLNLSRPNRRTNILGGLGLTQTEIFYVVWSPFYDIPDQNEQALKMASMASKWF